MGCLQGFNSRASEVIRWGYWIDLIAVKVVFMVHRVPSLRSGGQKVGGGLLDGGLWRLLDG